MDLTAASPCVPMLEASLRPWQVSGPRLLPLSAADMCDDRHILPFFISCAAHHWPPSRGRSFSQPSPDRSAQSADRSLSGWKLLPDFAHRPRLPALRFPHPPRWSFAIWYSRFRCLMPLGSFGASCRQKLGIIGAKKRNQTHAGGSCRALPDNGAQRQSPSEGSRLTSPEAVRAACLGSPLRKK